MACSLDFFFSILDFIALSFCSRISNKVARFLKTTVHPSRSDESVSEKVLFALPILKEGMFEGRGKKNSRCRRKRAFDHAFHIGSMALNF